MNMKEKEKMLLNVCGLCKSYERFALQDICFSLEPGYILGVIGKNGSGKSTLIECYWVAEREQERCSLAVVPGVM